VNCPRLTPMKTATRCDKGVCQVCHPTTEQNRTDNALRFQHTTNDHMPKTPSVETQPIECGSGCCVRDNLFQTK
jgi:hypothetical protein